jgi:threonine dehydratase
MAEQKPTKSDFYDFQTRVLEAYGRIRNEIIRTRLEYSPVLSRELGARIYLKWECDQKTGSFKLRGALNKLRTLPAEQKKRGIVSASTGNHGLALSYASKIEGVSLTLFLPDNAVREKIQKIGKFGVDLKFHGASCEQAEIHARRIAAETGRIFISPYNDYDIIHGQGTLGIEILEELPDLDDVLVPVGGGGLIAGIGGYLKSLKPSVKIWGVEPINSAFMRASLAAGRLVEIREKPTLADAVAGGMEPGAVTFPVCQAYVDGILTVSESGLKSALRRLYEVHAKVVEGAGALPLAGLIKARRRFQGRKAVLVVSGGNIAPDLFKKMTRRKQK